MNNYNIVLELEQEAQDRIACQVSPYRNKDLYYAGEWDGKMNDAPRNPDDRCYWAGYCAGLQQYWMNKKPSVKAEVF
jgi:hypothetical protein